MYAYRRRLSLEDFVGVILGSLVWPPPPSARLRQIIPSLRKTPKATDDKSWNFFRSVVAIIIRQGSRPGEKTGVAIGGIQPAVKLREDAVASRTVG